jgi:hypothetical protein
MLLRSAIAAATPVMAVLARIASRGLPSRFTRGAAATALSIVVRMMLVRAT